MRMIHIKMPMSGASSCSKISFTENRYKIMKIMEMEYEERQSEGEQV